MRGPGSFRNHSTSPNPDWEQIRAQPLLLPQGDSFSLSTQLACTINTAPENISDWNCGNAHVNAEFTAFSMTIKEWNSVVKM